MLSQNFSYTKNVKTKIYHLEAHTHKQYLGSRNQGILVDNVRNVPSVESMPPSASHMQAFLVSTHCIVHIRTHYCWF